MQDIYIDDVKIKNCRGHFEMEMDFPIDSFTVIQGKNGAGKSTIPKSISMALFGDDGAPSGDKILITDMVNKKKGKDLEIIVNLRIVDSETNVTDEYRIELYYEHKVKHNQLILFKNDIPISEKTKSDTYKKIENLLYPKDVYHNVIYFSQQVKNFFTSLTNSEQKQIFDAILQTKVYNTYYKTTFNSERIVDEKLVKVTYDINSLTKELVLHKETLDMLQKTKIKSENENHALLADARIRLTNIENQSQVVDDSVQSIEFYSDEYEKLKLEQVKLEQLISSLEQSAQEQLNQLEDKSVHDFREVEMEIQNHKHAELEKIRLEIEVKKKVISDKISVLYEQMSTISGKYNTTPITKDCNEFVSDKRKDLQAISFEINQLDAEYSTSKLEFEKEERLVIIDRNIQELKDKATELKSNATSYKQELDEKKKTITEDEAALTGPTPICTKCLRPFSNSENTGAIQGGIDKIKIRISELDSLLSKCKTKMEELKVEFEDGNKVRLKAKSDFDNQIQSVIQAKEQRVSEFHRKQNLLNQEIEEYQKLASDKIEKIHSEMDAETLVLRKEQDVLQSKINELDKQLEDEGLSKSQAYDKETQLKKTEHNKKYTSLRAELKSKLDADCISKSQSLDNCKDKIARLEILKVQIEKLEDQKRELQYELKSVNERIKTAENYSFDCTQIENTSFRISQVENGLQENVNQESILRRELEIIQFWKVGFSDAGIKSMLIDMAIPHMNEAVSESLEKMAPGIFTVSFDTLRENKAGDISDKFTVNILHNLKGTDSHKMLSGGEKRIVDLACMEALRSLAERLYGKRIHNIFYDEVLDSLDEDNRQIFCQYSKLISRDKNVTLITHNTAEDMEPDRIFKL